MTLKLDAHDLMPASVAAKIPLLDATENDNDPTAWVKLFTPDSSWTFYVTEYSPAERLCFGLVIRQEGELVFFDLAELERACGPLGLLIERDLHWQPRPLSQCAKESPMMHHKRRWVMGSVATVEELARMLTQSTWTLCSGFHLAGHPEYLFLNDATHEDGCSKWPWLK